MASNSATASPLYNNLDERGLLVKILCELRVLNLILSDQYGIRDDISALRQEVMSQDTAVANPATSTDV